MEFIVVAPLYFILLGGLFYVGEFILNRIRINIGDQVLTWSVASRFVEDKRTISSCLVDWIFGDTLEQARLTVDLSSDSRGANEFCGLYIGGIDKIEIGLPSWAIGMFTLQKVLSGEPLDKTDTQSRFTYFEGSDNHVRTVVMHKKGDADVRPGYVRSKSIESCDLIPRNYLANVISDTWIHSDADQKVIGQVGSDKGGYIPRQLIQWGE